MKRRYLIIICAAAVMIFAAVGVTLAYLGGSSEKENKLTVGEGLVSINETFSSPSAQTLSDNVFQKVVKVKNTGTDDCFVRVFVDFSDQYARDKAWVSQNKDSGYILWNDFVTASQTISPDWVFIPETDANGALGGYFYYTKKVAKNAETPPLFSYIKTDYSKQSDGTTNETYLNNTSSEDFITDFDIIVYSETVQTVDHGTVYSDSQWQQAWKSFLK